MYGNHRSHIGTDQLPQSGSDHAPMTGDTVETIAFGTVFHTPTGQTTVEALRVGDVIIDAYGQSRAVLWMREDRSASAGQNVLRGSPGHQTRFPGVRFVRGRRADTSFQIIFSEPVTVQDSSPQPQLQDEPEYVAEFSSSRARTNKDDDAETQLAAE